ncbi:14559_t:CDS:2, partial [Dentiscutata heterogama]
MEPIYIESDSDNINTDNYEPTINYESNDDYEFNDDESIYKESEIEIPVADLTEPNSYSPFDDYEVIATQLSKLVNNNKNSNYDNDSSINLITENLR